MNLRKVWILFFVIAISGCVYVTQGPFPEGNRSAYVSESSLDSKAHELSKVVYAPQGWNNAESLWFYNTTQGSNLISYDIF